MRPRQLLQRRCSRGSIAGQSSPKRSDEVGGVEDTLVFAAAADCDERDA
jgi:hypothetical protein